MQRTFLNPYFPTMRRVRQKTSSHCAPAVLEMLASYVGKDVDQDAFVEAAEATEKLRVYGMTVDEMGRAVTRLVPDVQFWYKHHGTLSELTEIVRIHKYPVGIEWQGVFYEDADEDNGHYSIVTHIDTVNNIIVLADPYKRFAGSDRSFHVLEFEERWWDENEIIDTWSRKHNIVRDEHTMFIITPKDVFFPEYLGMYRG
ncbi:cysteine peptidase family C39 domain-containing protein [Patescibacteria group bacterium]|nr:cysteine peptidase family C39 domain-containing protein [Patescibacteria group bacterium]